MKGFEGYEPTTGQALSESQREIFKLLGLNEDASSTEIAMAYSQMSKLYEDKSSPAFIRIKEAYNRLAEVRENLSVSGDMKSNKEVETRKHILFSDEDIAQAQNFSDRFVEKVKRLSGLGGSKDKAA